MALEQTNPLSDSIAKTLSNIQPPQHVPQLNIDSNATSENDSDPYRGNEFKRQDGLKTAVHQVTIWGIRIAFFIFIAVFAIRVLHLVLPSGRRWLTGEDIQGIDKLFFSGTIGGVIGNYLKDVLPRKR